MYYNGIGLRKSHYSEVFNLPYIKDFLFEVHADNFFTENIYPHKALRHVADQYPLSFHSVGLSLASCDDLHLPYIQRIKGLIDEYKPVFISDHLAWVGVNGEYLHDLLPFPYCNESLEIVSSKVSKVQDYLQLEILVENPALYVSFPNSDILEADFLNILSQKTGCGILLDITNLYISSKNLNFDPYKYLSTLNTNNVKEIHIAGFETMENGIIIDTHSQSPSKEVKALLHYFIKHYGKRSTVLEYDQNIPNLTRLFTEMEQIMNFGCSLSQSPIP